MGGDNIRINNTPRNIFKASFVLTSNKFIPFWKCALTKHWTPSQLLFKDNIFVKCFLIAAFQSLTEAVSSIISLFLQLRSQITFVWKFFLVLIFYQVWKTRVKIMSGSTCIRKPGFFVFVISQELQKLLQILGEVFWIKPSATYLSRDSSKIWSFRPKKLVYLR